VTSGAREAAFAARSSEFGHNQPIANGRCQVRCAWCRLRGKSSERAEDLPRSARTRRRGERRSRGLWRTARASAGGRTLDSSWRPRPVGDATPGNFHRWVLRMRCSEAWGFVLGVAAQATVALGLDVVRLSARLAGASPTLFGHEPTFAKGCSRAHQDRPRMTMHASPEASRPPCPKDC
jgi:hypothetical protein